MIAFDKINLPDLEPPVTVIGAMNCGDHLLIAADSEVQDDEVTVAAQKLDSLTIPPITWGYSGDEAIADEFGLWLKARDWSAEPDWSSFRNDAAAELSRLNGDKRRTMRRAGVRPRESDTTSILIVGYLTGEPEILEIDAAGRTTFYKRDRFAAIGGGRNHAKIVFLTVLALKKDDFTYDDGMMRDIMTLAARFAPKCGPPITLRRIRPNGVEELRQDGAAGSR